MATVIATWAAVLALTYLVLLILAWVGLLGERAHRYMTELNETGKRKLIERQLRDADDASAAAHLDARSAMNEAAGQEWRNLTEWRHD